ncbi:MAG TPA: hypothetical protein VMY35_10600 [Phycisphaerae bacterium]|nr:hypothetical protein [Phycisphaerae bacterium]
MSQDQTATRDVLLRGLRPIMFDRYPGDNKTQLPPGDKLYLDGGTVVLPAENVMSFLTAVNTTSAPKRLLDKREYKDVCGAFQCFVEIMEENIPFLRDGKPIKFSGFGDGDPDPRTGIFVDKRVARLDRGVPNPKERPVLPLPWELRLTIKLYANQEVGEPMLRQMFVEGGVALGFGTFRGRFGKFEVAEWQ